MTQNVSPQQDKYRRLEAFLHTPPPLLSNRPTPLLCEKITTTCLYLQYYLHVSSRDWLLANDKHIYRRWRKMGHVTELDTCKLCVHINTQQDRRYTYNVTLGPFSKTTVATERQQCVTSVLLSYTSVKNITIMIVAQQCFYEKKCNHCWNGKATMRYFCIVELHVCQKCNNNECRTTVLLWQTYVAGNNKTYLDLHVKCPTLNQILRCRYP
jgi:hypothetical protein